MTDSSAYEFFGQAVLVETNLSDVKQALDAIYERQRVPLLSSSEDYDLSVVVRSGETSRPAATPANDSVPDAGPRIDVGDRTIRVPDVRQLVHYAHLVLINAAASRAEDYVVLHSGAVSRDGRAILLVGHSGRGKTTLTLELVRRGWGFLSDDFAVLDSSGVVHPFPRRVNLTDDSLSLLKLSPSAHGIRVSSLGGREKWLIDIDDLFPGRLAGSSQLAAGFVLGPMAYSGNVLKTSELGSEDGISWYLQLDHLPSGLVSSMAEIPGVKSVSLGSAEGAPIVQLRLARGARVVAEIDEVCALHDVTVLSAGRSAPRADGETVPPTDLTGAPSTAQLAPSDAIRELLAGALCLSGRRFFEGTTHTEVLKSVAVLHTATSARNTPMFRLAGGGLTERADVIEKVVETLGAP